MNITLVVVVLVEGGLTRNWRLRVYDEEGMRSLRVSDWIGRCVGDEGDEKAGKRRILTAGEPSAA